MCFSMSCDSSAALAATSSAALGAADCVPSLASGSVSVGASDSCVGRMASGYSGWARIAWSSSMSVMMRSDSMPSSFASCSSTAMSRS